MKGGRKNEEASVNALVSLQVMIFLLFSVSISAKLKNHCVN